MGWPVLPTKGVNMKAILLKTQEQTSKFGGKFYYAFFKGEDGKSYRSCLYPNYGNFARWKHLIGKEGVTLTGLNARGGMIDADSFPQVINTV
jgi:hypothetical protein